MYITLSISGHGHHPAAWRKSTLPLNVGGIPRYDGVVRVAEAATLDAVIFTPTRFDKSLLANGITDVLQIDNLSVIGALAAVTNSIGLGASSPIRYNEPFNVARSFSALDNLTAGRSCWLVDLEGHSWSPADFGHASNLSIDDHYCRAEEFLIVVRKLWDSWEDGAVLADKLNGMFADSGKIHPINHAGNFFSVRGPLVAVRPPQGHPPIFMDDMSSAGKRLAASYGDVLIASWGDRAQAISLMNEMRAASKTAGRGGAALKILMTLCPILAKDERAAKNRADDLDQSSDQDAVRSMPRRFVGTPAGLVSHMSEWVDAGACDGFNLAFPVLSEDVSVLVQDVVPKLKQAGLFRAEYPGSTMREHLGLRRPTSQFSKDVA
jgi:alkanesulfonate monooxygenase SsuD/methylene tetrahydromethanopterin reductase-like flavin-dependent oxidoreductase (luciferase family)